MRAILVRRHRALKRAKRAFFVCGELERVDALVMQGELEEEFVEFGLALNAAAALDEFALLVACIDRNLIQACLVDKRPEDWRIDAV